MRGSHSCLAATDEDFTNHVPRHAELLMLAKCQPILHVPQARFFIGQVIVLLILVAVLPGALQLAPLFVAQVD